jgi:hypothetical protein
MKISDPRIIRSLILALLFGLLLTMIFRVKEGFQMREIGYADGGKGGLGKKAIAGAKTVAALAPTGPTIATLTLPAAAEVAYYGTDLLGAPTGAGKVVGDVFTK